MKIPSLTVVGVLVTQAPFLFTTAQESCFGDTDFTVYFRDECTYDSLVERMKVKIDETDGGCENTAEQELELLLEPKPLTDYSEWRDMQTGYCVRSNGRDQNSGVQRIGERKDFGPSQELLDECFELCKAVDYEITGCEAIWHQGNRGCYTHTQEVARGNFAERHACWVKNPLTAEEEAIHAEVKGICKVGLDEFEADPTNIVQFSKLADKGDQFDKEYYDGNTFWNQEYETEYETLVPGLEDNRLKRDAERVDDLYETVARRAQFTWPDDIPNFEDCSLRSAMCCWVTDRQANDNNGNCKTPYDERCTDADPGDNTDLCAVDLSRSGSDSIHMEGGDGFALYPGDNNDGEGAIHCHGLAWGQDDTEADARFKANNLFYVSMYDHMHQRGYVRNVPGAPMCGCVEKMPIVSRSDCTEIDATETWKFDWSNGGFRATLERTEIEYNACQGANNRNNDLEAFYLRLLNEGRTTYQDFREFKKTVVGNGQCDNAMANLFVENGYEIDPVVPGWTQVYGRGSLYYPLESHDEFWSYQSYATYVGEPVFYVLRKCLSCRQESHKYIIYKRYTPVPADLDIKDLFLANWFDTNGNTFHEDFDLFSTMEDAESGVNKWQFCNFNDRNIGFPRDCGPTGRVNSEWNSLTRGGETDFAFYVKNDNPHNPAPTMVPTSSPAPTTVSRNNVHVKYYSGYWSSVPDFSAMEPYAVDYLPDMTLESNSELATSGTRYRVGIEFNAYVKFPTSGPWTLYITSDDGSRLYVDDVEIINNDGHHGMIEKSGVIQVDTQGEVKHIRVGYMQGYGGSGMVVSWRRPGVDKEPIPQEAYGFKQYIMPTMAPTITSPKHLLVRYYQGYWSQLPNFDSMLPFKSDHIENMDDQDGGTFMTSGEQYKIGAVFDSDVKFPSEGTWTLYTKSDDGSKLYIDGVEIVNNDGSHGMREKSGTINVVKGEETKHIRVTFFQGYGGLGLVVSWSGPGFSKRVIPGHAFVEKYDHPTLAPTPTPLENVRARYYAGWWTKLPDFDQLTSYSQNFVANIHDLDSSTPFMGSGKYDGVGVSFDSYLQFPSTGQWTLYTRSDDGSKLWIDSALVVDNDGLHGLVEKSGIVSVSAGEEKKHIRVTFFERGGGEGLSVSWSGPGVEKQIIPISAFVEKYTSGTMAPTVTPPHYVNVKYYVGAWRKVPDFSTLNPYKTDKIPTIYHTSNSNPFMTSGRYSYVGALFTADLEFPSSGEWTLYTTSDDGSKLYVDGVEIVNNDGLHGMVERSGTVNVSAGDVKRIVVSYFERGGGHGLYVSWSGPGTGKAVIPMEAWKEIEE